MARRRWHWSRAQLYLQLPGEWTPFFSLAHTFIHCTNTLLCFPCYTAATQIGQEKKVYSLLPEPMWSDTGDWHWRSLFCVVSIPFHRYWRKPFSKISSERLEGALFQ